MSKKQRNLKVIFVVFIFIEIVLVIFSSNFQKKLEFGIAEGKFFIKSRETHFDLQEKITENFQSDEYLALSNNISQYQVNDFNALKNKLLSSDHVMEKVVTLLDSNTVSELKTTELAKDKSLQSKLTNELNESVIKNPAFYQESFLTLLNADNPEEKHLAGKLKSKEKLSRLDRMRVNRIILETRLAPDIIKSVEVVPEIYGSYELYDIFRSTFGEASALSTFNLLRMLLLIDLIFIFMIIIVRRGLSHRPSKMQLVIEMLYGVFDDFVKDTVGKTRTYFTPYIVTIFLFVLFCNIIGIIPIPGFMEPTRNLNVPLGLGIIVIIVVHFTAIRVKGVWKHMENYVNPVKNPLAALDIVSEVSKVVSISFRLFGNILGGAIIIVVVSSLVKFVVLPVGLNMFFGLFVGTIQAFVFTMLALTYIGVEITE